MTDLKEDKTQAQSLIGGFEVLLGVQRALQKAMGWPNGRGVDAVQTCVLHSHSELSEVLNEVHWKPHKKHLQEYGSLKDRAAFVMEITDVFQTLTNVALAYDVTPEELALALVAKWSVNFDKIRDGEVTHAE